MVQNPYKKTDWVDHIIDPTLPESDPNRIIQEGTRFTASRANKIEGGIYDLYNKHFDQDDAIQKLRVQLEMVGRVPINNGTFFDTLDGQNAKQLTRLTKEAVVQSTLSVGATTITLGAVPFIAGEYVTVYDDVNAESVKIENVTSAVITVPALAKAYKKGARVARSNSVIDTTAQRMKIGGWGTYSVSAVEVV